MAVAQNMGGKAYAAFVSHCKAECAMEARFLQTELEAECAACMDETDLKRETSRKLKEEVIDNDRLTLANLNRIKHLEAQLERQARRAHRQASP